MPFLARLWRPLPAAERAAGDAVHDLLDRALGDLKGAPPLGQAAALARLVELQAAILRDLHNRDRAREREIAALRAELQGRGGAAIERVLAAAREG